MVRIARDSNTSMLIPNFTDLTEAPAELVQAIQHAYTILNWYENVPSDEMPPAWMWPFPDETGQWFDEVKEARRREREGGGESSNMDGNAWTPDDD